MSKYSEFQEWMNNLTNEKSIYDMLDSLIDKQDKIKMGMLAQNGFKGKSMATAAAVSIAYANHCTAPLLERIAELEAALTMRPISEAPQDGTQYLAWNGLSYMVLNQPDESYSIGEWEFVDGEWIGHHVGHHPTHFLPLPTPPKGDAP